jgi:hypothetical protein
MCKHRSCQQQHLFLIIKPRAKAEKKKSGKGQLIKGMHQPIISEELFAQCLKVRSKRRHTKNTHQNTRHVYILSSIIICNCCKRNLRAQSARYGRYYRDASRFLGVDCSFSTSSVRADLVEEQIGLLMESIVLPDNWQVSLQDALKTPTEGPDPQKEKARIKGEIRRMRESYNRGLYESDVHSFWRDIEALQMQLEAIEQITPHEVRQAAVTLLGLREAWGIATLDERKVLCKMLLKDIVFDFEKKLIVSIRPRSEYAVLFQMVPSLQAIGDGSYSYHFG